MACRGVLFAIADDLARALLDATTDDEIRSIIETVEHAWEVEHLAETDKAWDAIHRALTDGSLDADVDRFPLARVILGGRQLHRGDDYIVSLVGTHEVPALAQSLAQIDDAAFRDRYRRLIPADYAVDHGDLDCEPTAAYFRDVVELYERAARAGRAVVFTVDQ